MKEVTQDWFDPVWAQKVLDSLPAPVSPRLHKRLWEKGIRLHGNQKGLVMDPWRFKKGDGGIRFGKSFAPAATIFLDTMWRMNVTKVYSDLYGVIGDTYAMAQAEMEHLDRLLTDAKIQHSFSTPKDASWEIQIPGLPWMTRTLSASDVTKIASKPYRGMVIAEVAQQNEDVLDKAIGRVSETGGWVMATGTYEKQKGRWSARLTAEWLREDGLGVVYTCPSWDNPLVFPGGRTDPEILARETSWPRAKFLEIYAGEPQMPSDLVLPQAVEEHVLKRRYPRQGTSYNPEQPVVLFSDPGVAHATAVLAVQFDWSPEYLEIYYDLKRSGRAFGYLGKDSGNIAWVIDAIYRWNRETKIIVKEAMERPWAENVVALVIDQAARQRNSNGPPVIEQWAKFWMEGMRRRLAVYYQPVPLEDGYDVHRTALRNAWPEEAAQAEFNADRRLRSVIDPAGLRLYIDPVCRPIFWGGIVDGQDYGGEYLLHRNERTSGGAIMNDEPRDRDNDAIKALNYGLYWWAGPGRVKHQYSNLYHQRFEMVG